MTKRSPRQVLDALDGWDEDDAIDAEMDRVLAMAPEERESELRAARVDVEAERGKAREWRQRVVGGEVRAHAIPPSAVAPVVPLRATPRRRVPRLVMLLAATLGGTLVAGVVWQASTSSDAVTSGRPAPLTPQELREEAFASCDAQRWDQCLRGLDAARERDPAGDGDARVTEYRQRAENALRGRPPSPPR